MLRLALLARFRLSVRCDPGREWRSQVHVCHGSATWSLAAECFRLLPAQSTSDSSWRAHPRSGCCAFEPSNVADDISSTAAAAALLTSGVLPWTVAPSAAMQSRHASAVLAAMKLPMGRRRRRPFAEVSRHLGRTAACCCPGRRSDWQTQPSDCLERESGQKLRVTAKFEPQAGIPL